ncbi:hypothetical protein EVAR_78091_1 [Eumeta japonica]|uniref:Uncharacterized protein n=1 Tax=Eumeta variegata TaxID=151549 RepID=A0A4C1T199_EUMVA|nr:hypothetical protein EVAR_78091_1 [Eumeta japonica]
MTMLAVISAETTRFLEDQKSTGYPPYHPYLAPNNFYLFPSVKNKLRDQRFSSREKAVDAFKMHVLENIFIKTYKILKEQILHRILQSPVGAPNLNVEEYPLKAILARVVT